MYYKIPDFPQNRIPNFSPTQKGQSGRAGTAHLFCLLHVRDEVQNAQPKTVMVAWNESVEALTAIRKALPFLIKAELVRVVVIDPPQHGPERSDPGGMLCQMLARHGVTCEIDVLSRSLSRVSDILNRYAVDTNSDMMVMGAYGHSRFREAILGGATRNMLEQAMIPVFMAH